MHPSRVVFHGIAAGLISGIAFSAAESFVAILHGNTWDAPVRMVAAVAMGPSALGSDRSLAGVLVWGMGLHLLYTIGTGILLAALIAGVDSLRRSSRAAVSAALLYALALWLSGFYVVAPLLGWEWFPERTRFLPQLALQVGVWGGSLAAYFAPRRVRLALA
ncbi:MAG: hypothetical protein ABR599_02535 [Gemmatimonadota bacterium]